MSETFLNGKVTLLRGDCLELLPTLEADSIDSCVTDPPYHLTSIVKRFGKEGSKPPRSNLDRDPDTLQKASGPNHQGGARSPYATMAEGYARLSKGFMGKQWDGGDIAFRPELWAEVWRVLKPGAHLLAFSGTRTYHRMACAIEDAGFEIRDQIGWCYGSGFPKSHDISKAIDRLNGEQRPRDVVPETRSKLHGDRPWMNDPNHRFESKEPISGDAIQWQGWGTALKPAWEPIVLARKPLSESSIAANVLKHGTGAINIDGCRIATADSWQPSTRAPNDSIGTFKTNERTTEQHSLGRWPANLIHDGSEEVLAGFPEQVSPGNVRHNGAFKSVAKGAESGRDSFGFADSGSAARFFYTAKADADDRLGSNHPTVKPLDLISYLIRLIAPKGGVVLDPFAGTGTAGEAAFREGVAAVLIEREPEYQADIVKRMGLCLAGPDERRAASVKQTGVEDTPLFGGL